MTTTEVVELSDAQDQSTQPRSWGDMAVSLSGTIAELAEHRRGDLAALRRMNPDDPDAAVFWKLLAQYDLLDSGETVESKWALILQGIALMTPTNSGGDNPQTAHEGYMPVGRALFLGGEAQRAQGFYSESRLNRLLTARGSMLRVLLARMFRMLAGSGVSFNWREMAQFILNEGYNENASEQGRRRIARNYYQAARRSSQQSEAQGE